jgi:hypothetical protein
MSLQRNIFFNQQFTTDLRLPNTYRDNASNGIIQVFNFLKTSVQLFIFQKHKELAISTNLFT